MAIPFRVAVAAMYRPISPWLSSGFYVLSPFSSSPLHLPSLHLPSLPHFPSVECGIPYRTFPSCLLPFFSPFVSLPLHPSPPSFSFIPILFFPLGCYVCYHLLPPRLLRVLPSSSPSGVRWAFYISPSGLGGLLLVIFPFSHFFLHFFAKNVSTLHIFIYICRNFIQYASLFFST